MAYSTATARKVSDISVFHDSDVQWILALFLTKPYLYEGYSNHKDRQDFFFNRFRKFADNYYNFSEDESIYFGSTRKELAGEANICGGTGSSSNYLKSRYRRIEQNRENRIDNFAKKYGVSFTLGRDPRLFLNVKEIWKKLENAQEIVATSKWADAPNRSYSDITFTLPIPHKLEKVLVHLGIRNKTFQKFRYRQTTSSVHSIRKPEAEDDEQEEDVKSKNEKKTGTMLVIPPEVNDEDW